MLETLFRLAIWSLKFYALALLLFAPFVRGVGACLLQGLALDYLHANVGVFSHCKIMRSHFMHHIKNKYLPLSSMELPIRHLRRCKRIASPWRNIYVAKRKQDTIIGRFSSFDLFSWSQWSVLFKLIKLVRFVRDTRKVPVYLWYPYQHLSPQQRRLATPSNVSVTRKHKSQR